MIRRFVQWTAWLLCLAANATPVAAAAMLAPDRLSQVAAATTLALMAALLAVERLLPYRADWTTGGDREIWRDVGHTLAYAAPAVNATRVLFLVALGDAMASRGLTDVLGLWPARSPVWTQIALVIVAGDFLEYVYHRLCHSYGFLWRLHAIHHTPVRLHALKGGRHHVLYAFGRGAVVWLPLLLLGAPPGLVYWQFVAETITGLAGHANVEFRIPAFVHRLAVTPEFHRLHHAEDPRLGNSNFGVVFPFWDMAFGTHSDPLTLAVREAGIQHDPIPKRFLEELASPLTYGRLMARSRARAPIARPSVRS